MNIGRLPWEIVETFPSTDTDLLAQWDTAVNSAVSPADLVRALTGRGLALYWATQEAVLDEPWADVAIRRSDDLDHAVHLARETGNPGLLAEALLGMLYGTWGPDRHLDRAQLLAELTELRPSIIVEECRWKRTGRLPQPLKNGAGKG